MNFLIKWLTVLAVMAVGVLFLSRGLGIDLPIVKYKGLEAHNVPIGLLIFAGGIVLAAVWKVSTTKTTTTTTKDGLVTTITTTMTSVIRAFRIR